MAKIKHLHERRKVTLAQLGAILGVRGMLDRGYIHYDKSASPVAGEHKFNMGCVLETAHCGTVGCIGGMAGLILGDLCFTQNQKYHHARGLGALFYPPEGRNYLPYNQITAKMAIKAIDNWLNTGRPLWSTIIQA